MTRKKRKLKSWKKIKLQKKKGFSLTSSKIAKLKKIERERDSSFLFMCNFQYFMERGADEFTGALYHQMNRISVVYETYQEWEKWYFDKKNSQPLNSLNREKSISELERIEKVEKSISKSNQNIISLLDIMNGVFSVIDSIIHKLEERRVLLQKGRRILTRNQLILLNKKIKNSFSQVMNYSSIFFIFNSNYLKNFTINTQNLKSAFQLEIVENIEFLQLLDEEEKQDLLTEINNYSNFIYIFNDSAELYQLNLKIALSNFSIEMFEFEKFERLNSFEKEDLLVEEKKKLEFLQQQKDKVYSRGRVNFY